MLMKPAASLARFIYRIIPRKGTENSLSDHIFGWLEKRSRAMKSFAAILGIKPVTFLVEIDRGFT